MERKNMLVTIALSLHNTETQKHSSCHKDESFKTKCVCTDAVVVCTEAARFAFRYLWVYIVLPRNIQLVGQLVGMCVRSDLLLRGTIIIRTFDQHKNLYIPVFLLTVFGPDYYVPR